MKPMTRKERRRLQSIVDGMGYRNYYDDDVEVRQAGKVGYGVYALRQFSVGELIFAIQGQLIPVEEYEGSDYAIDFGNGMYMEPYAPGAFLNHSCDPNAELVSLDDEHMGLVAICNIEADRPITFDYGWEALPHSPPCQCGSRKCRGWVVAEDEVKKMRKLATSTEE